MNDYGIVETHIHLWDLRHLRYTWLDENEVLNRDFLPADFQDAARDVPVEQIVFAQAAALPEQALAEAEWIAQIAASDEPRITGIVADAPLENGDRVTRDLDALARLPLVKGIRRLIQIDDDPAGLCRRSSFVEGIRLLSGYGWTFDICVHRDTLPAVSELVAKCPDVQFVLDHMGNPNTVDGEIEPWRRDIAALAERENVVCKLSGMLSAAAPDWTVDSLRPYADHIVESFGPDRVMYGSDWPVITRAGTYSQWYDAVNAFLAGYSDDEQRNIMRDNAIRVYRLGGA